VTYTTRGRLDGECGHKHRTIQAAEDCVHKRERREVPDPPDLAQRPLYYALRKGKTMIDNKDLAVELVRRLNGLIEEDDGDRHIRNFIGSLIEARVEVDPEFVDSHPTIQGHVEDGKGYMGFLGLLNGIVGTLYDGGRYVAAHFDNDSKFTHFIVRDPEKNKLVEET